MTKTNLEIEEEFIQHLRSVGLNIQGETENLYRGVAQWWLSKLQQRMDEIEGEVQKMKNQTSIEFQDYPSKVWKINNGKMPFVMWNGKADEEEKFQIWRTGFMEASGLTKKVFIDVLNIIKSVDKNKNND